jgi:hypothetical protein
MRIGERFRLGLFLAFGLARDSEPSCEDFGLWAVKDLRMLVMRAWRCVLCYFCMVLFSRNGWDLGVRVVDWEHAGSMCCSYLQAIYSQIYLAELVRMCGMRWFLIRAPPLSFFLVLSVHLDWFEQFDTDSEEGFISGLVLAEYFLICVRPIVLLFVVWWGIFVSSVIGLCKFRSAYGSNELLPIEFSLGAISLKHCLQI